MSQTILGPALASITTLGAPVVETKKIWSDDWSYQPDIEVVSMGVHASSVAASSAQVLRRYGRNKYPYETAMGTRASLNLAGWWVRISFPPGPGDNAPAVQFVGQIEAESRTLLGASATGSSNGTIAAGEQHWVASGGLLTLQKLVWDSSVFAVSGQSTGQQVDWIPPMNARDKHDCLVGNRSDSQLTEPSAGGTSYVYGGKNIWTHLQYVQYLLAWGVQQKGGPTWSVSGQTDILAKLQTSIRFPEPVSIAGMLKKLIPPRFGLDWHVIPSADGKGFEINVFSLAADDTSYGGVTLAKNPSQVSVVRDASVDLLDVRLVKTDERHFDHIFVVGKRIVVCGTLWGTALSPGASPSLVGKWSTDIEDDYTDPDDAPDDATSDDLDRLRRREKYRNVYQSFGAPDDWDLDGATWAVDCDESGSVQQSAADGGGLITGSYQTAIRRTLPWLPLREGFDYSTSPPIDNRLDGPDADSTDTHQKPLLAWVWDTTPDTGSPLYEQADLVGISVHAPSNDWGVFLNGSPNHILAANHFTNADGSAPKSNVDPRYDCTKTIATIAIESDHRLKLGYDVPANLAAGDGSVMTIVDDLAECWVMLPNTVVDLTAAGEPVYSGSAPVILRNDVSRLALLLAGAKARYTIGRVRCQITARGLLPWGGLAGQMLSVIQSGDDSVQVGSPITSIEWTMGHGGGEPTTVVKTGYA